MSIKYFSLLMLLSLSQIGKCIAESDTEAMQRVCREKGIPLDQCKW
jgi:hypothetical protein